MDIREYSKYVIFSNLSYVLWESENTDNSSLIGKLVHKSKRLYGDAFDAGDSLSGTVAEKVFDQDGWKVESSYPKLEYKNEDDYSGFAASFFSNSEEKILAIRGTETGNGEASRDLWKSDLHEIGAYGLAISQAIDLFNYINLLRAEKGEENVLQLEYRKETTKPEDVQHYLT